jgi:uncharacterized membrane protein YhaH (DUF805 family)
MADRPVTTIWSYEGRSTRSGYFAVLLGTSFLGAIAGLVIGNGGEAQTIFGVMLCLPLFWLSACVCIRRLHDLGYSGWWTFVSLVPVVNVAFGIYLLFAPGQDHDNDFGPLTSKPSSQPFAPEVAVQFQRQAPELTVAADAFAQTPAASELVSAEPVEEFWAQALHECQTDAMKAGLWAKAFAESAGDEKVAKATYIRLRATQLQAQYADHQQALQLIRDQERQVEQERHAAQQAEVAALLAKMNEDERAKAMLPKGRCPACEAVIPLESKECPHCAALFSEDSKWKVKPLNRYEAIAQKAVDNSTVYSLRTKEEKESESVGGLIFLGVLLLFVVVAAANA